MAQTARDLRGPAPSASVQSAQGHSRPVRLRRHRKQGLADLRCHHPCWIPEVGVDCPLPPTRLRPVPPRLFKSWSRTQKSTFHWRSGIRPIHRRQASGRGATQNMFACHEANVKGHDLVFTRAFKGVEEPGPRRVQDHGRRGLERQRDPAQRGTLVDVDLHQRRPAFRGLDQLLEDRRDRRTWAAPLCPEVDENPGSRPAPRRSSAQSGEPSRTP